MALITKAFGSRSSRYPDLAMASVKINDLKTEVKAAIESMDGKPTDYTTSKSTHVWKCVAGDASKIMSLPNPTKNQYYRFAAMIIRLQPLLDSDLGMGSLKIINEGINKEHRFNNPILDITYNCNEFTDIIIGSNQWIDSKEGKVTAIHQCAESIVKPGTVMTLVDVIIIYQHTAKPFPIKPLPMTKKHREAEVDKIENYIETHFEGEL